MTHSTDASLYISFVIPCYRSENTVLPVIDEIQQVMEQKRNIGYEVIAVVDGSPDNVFQVLCEASRNRPYLIVIDLSTNFTKTNAQMAGYNIACGDIIVSLDDDGQCPLDRLWDLIAPIQNGADMAAALFPKKQQSTFKNIGSSINRAMMHGVIGLPNDFSMSNFFAFNRLIAEELKRYKSPFPYYSGMINRVSSKLVNVPMGERKRISGSSTYTFKKMLSQWLNGFTSYSIKPLRIADFTGVVCAFLGIVYGIILIVSRLINAGTLPGYTSIIASIFFIGGIIMIMLGLIGEYVGRLMIMSNNVPQYTIRHVVRNGKVDSTETVLVNARRNMQ